MKTFENNNTYVDERVAILIREFEQLAPLTATKREKGDRNTSLVGWKALAAREARALKLQYPDDQRDNGSAKPEAERTYNTCLRQITALKKALNKAAKNDLLDSANVHKVGTIIKHFGDALSFQFAQYKMAQNVEQRSRVQARSGNENRIEINIEPQLKLALKTLQACKDGASKFQVAWEDVICAVALATGRRMAEIHCSGKFEAVADYELLFSGQLKGKNSGITTDTRGNVIRLSNAEFKQMRDFNQLPKDAKFTNLIDYAYTIPTLLPADLIVAGIEWLADEGKRLPATEDPELVNKRWGKPLSEIVRGEWQIVSNETFQAIDPKDKWTFHKLRGCYFIACLNNADQGFSAAKRLAESILGDKDITAITNYERFEIAPGTASKL